MEQIWKAGLQRLTKECFHNCDNVRKLVLNPSEPGLIRALGLDASKFRRLRQMDGDTETLAWLQLEKRTGQRITDDMLRWSKKEQIGSGVYRRPNEPGADQKLSGAAKRVF